MQVPLTTLALACAVASAALAAEERRLHTGAVNVRSFRRYAVKPGTQEEDWQPAFQQAITIAQDERRAIYVPAGEYRIRKAITVIPSKPLRIFGDGRHQSIIWQQIDAENCLNWTALAYQDHAAHGVLDNLQLTGGRITLNAKWHNHFAMTSCVISGAKRAGIHAEGWSNRFLNSEIRHCAGYGIYGGAGGHFNNCVIRDCYLGRCGIGVFLHGANGARIEGTCFENSNAGIFLGPVQNVTVNNCYFENVGNSALNEHYMANGRLKHVDGFPGVPPFNNIHIDYCRQVTIHDNIFRGQHDKDGAYISITVLVNGHIYDNQVQGSRNFVKLAWDSKTRRGKPDSTSRLHAVVVDGNGYLKVEDLLAEEKPGLIERAISQGCAFRMDPQATCEGSPVGVVQPQYLGHEIMDTRTKLWYKASGAKKTDWARLH